jgi:sigma-54-specific transcriptional regulator
MMSYTRPDSLDAHQPTLIAFENPQELSLLIRATAFVFSDLKSQALLSLIERIAPTDVTALITGETGTGKELVARHLHALSHRRHEPFVAVNCGAFSETLIESELFGYERGAFTGAQQNRQGWFEAAKGGSLFLDEIGDLPLPMQVKLLRVLQEREVVRVGSRKPIPIDVRLIAATNVNLREAVEAGRFREDLYYRLQVISLPLLSLRERPGDILPLANHFVKLYGKRLKLSSVQLSLEAEVALSNYPWPGNIRELENVIHRALLICPSDVVQVADLQLPAITHARVPTVALAVPPADNVVFLPESEATPVSTNHTDDEVRFRQLLAKLFDQRQDNLLETLTEWIVTDAYTHCSNNQVKTADVLGITRSVLRTYLKRVGLLTS